MQLEIILMTCTAGVFICIFIFYKGDYYAVIMIFLIYHFIKSESLKKIRMKKLREDKKKLYKDEFLILGVLMATVSDSHLRPNHFNQLRLQEAEYYPSNPFIIKAPNKCVFFLFT